MEIHEKLVSLFALRKPELEVLWALSGRPQNPTELQRQNNLPRATLYGALYSLRKRGLVKRIKVQGRFLWVQADKKPFSLDSLSDSDPMVTVHRGKEAVRELLMRCLEIGREERIYTYHGLSDILGWLSVVGIRGLTEGNRRIKTRRLIIERIIPPTYLSRMRRETSQEAQAQYFGQMTDTTIIPGEYFKSPAELLMFKDSVVLLHMGVKLAIEIKHSAFKTLLLSLFAFIRDHGRKVNPLEEK